MVPAPTHSIPEQEDIILNAAARCIEDSSLLDFTMASIAKEAGLSMGSIYKHVHSKEDILVALGTRMLKQHYRAFSEILSLPITMPERLICNALLSPHKLHAYSFGMHLEVLISNEAILKRASTRWTGELERLGQNIEDLFVQAIEKSYKDNELIVDPADFPRQAETLMVGLWSMCVGFLQVVCQQQTYNENISPFPIPVDHPIVESTHRLINTYRWQSPLDQNGILKACSLLEERGYRERETL